MLLITRKKKALSKKVNEFVLIVSYGKRDAALKISASANYYSESKQKVNALASPNYEKLIKMRSD